jgi:hypothetical protein
MTHWTAPSYDRCPHFGGGGHTTYGTTNSHVTIMRCSMCDEDHRRWVRAQPWWARLDEWHHQQLHDRPRRWFLWHLLWRPFCNSVERKYRR